MSTTKFKIGDKVRFKAYIDTGNSYSWLVVSRLIEDKVIMIVTEAWDHKARGGVYRVQGDSEFESLGELAFEAELELHQNKRRQLIKKVV